MRHHTSLLTTEYPSWTVTQTPGSGSTSVSHYRAGFSGGGTGGARIDATYNPNITGPVQQQQWIQTINTNLPLGGTSVPYIDPRPNDDTLPFYWTAAELPSYSSGVNLHFQDFSTRAISSLSTTSPITWQANLYPVEWNGATAVTVHDGIQWGWKMNPALKGSSTGTFLNPSPSCPPATCAGVGTNAFSWGIPMPDSGSLMFEPTAFNPKPDEVFSLGKLTYHNGATLAGSVVDSVDLNLAVNFDNIPEKSTTLHTSLGIVNTPNSMNPFTSADYVAFTSGGFKSSFNVFEGNTASAQLLAKISPSSSVIPADKSLDSPFTTSTDVSYALSLVDWGNISPGGFQETIPGDPTTIVPEPASLTLLSIGLLLLAGTAFRRQLRYPHGSYFPKT